MAFLYDSWSGDFLSSSHLTSCIQELVHSLHEPFKVTFTICFQDGCCKMNVYKWFLLDEIFSRFPIVDPVLKSFIFFYIVFINDIHIDRIQDELQQRELDLTMNKEKLNAYKNIDDRLNEVRQLIDLNTEEVRIFNEKYPNYKLLEYSSDLDCSIYADCITNHKMSIKFAKEDLKKRKKELKLFFPNHLNQFKSFYISQNSVYELSHVHLACVLLKNTDNLRYNPIKDVFLLTRKKEKGENEETSKEKANDWLKLQYSSKAILNVPKHYSLDMILLRRIQSFIALRSTILEPLNYTVQSRYSYILRIEDGNDFHAIAISERITRTYNSLDTRKMTLIIMHEIYDDIPVEHCLTSLNTYKIPLNRNMFCSYCYSTVYDDVKQDKDDTTFHEVNKRLTMKCGACKEFYYCGKECQLKDWKKGHNTECKKMPSLVINNNK